MIEKERKFLLKGKIPEGLVPVYIEQAYLMFDGKKHLRLRIEDLKKATLEIKIMHSNIYRECYPIPVDIITATELLKTTKCKIEKTRYSTTHDGLIVNIDVFPDGVKIVEIEFETVFLKKKLPEYCGKEVTGKSKYSNIERAKKAEAKCV